jgi:hypothetical protein
MADSKNKPGDKKTDLTPVEPMMARKRSSQQAMTAIGWVLCPCCAGDDKNITCTLCFDAVDRRFNRRVPVDVAIKWNKEQMGTKDTDPEMPAIKLDDDD